MFNDYCERCVNILSVNTFTVTALKMRFLISMHTCKMAFVLFI